MGLPLSPSTGKSEDLAIKQGKKDVAKRNLTLKKGIVAKKMKQ